MAGEYNRITCECVTGKYRDKQLTIEIGDSGEDCYFFVGDKKLDKVKSCNISMKTDKITKIIMTLIKED